MKNKVSIKKIVKLLGNIAAVIAVIFVIRRFLAMGADLNSFTSSEMIIALGLAVAVQTLTLCVGCFPCLRFIEIFSGKKIPFSAAMTVYTKANIYKYIPGNVFQYVGRNKLASDMEVSHVDVACSTILDVICGIIPLGIISVVTLGDYVLTIMQDYWKSTLIVISVGIVLLFIIIAVVFIFRKRLSNYLTRYKAVLLPENRKILLSVAAYYIIMASISASANFIAAYLIFDSSTSVNQLIMITGGYIFSWILGYITPGAPGGIGIRESVMLLICGKAMETTVMTYALLFRISSVFSDILGFVIGTVYEKIKLSAKKENK